MKCFAVCVKSFGMLLFFLLSLYIFINCVCVYVLLGKNVQARLVN